MTPFRGHACQSFWVSPRKNDHLARVAEICLSFPEVVERLSHGAPTYFVRDKKSFASLMVSGHHQFDFAHLVCASDLVVQAALVAERPDSFFVPPYVGGRGWIGVRLDRDLTLNEIGELCEDAYRLIAPATLVRRLDAP
jgi:hypothetical protein